VKHDPAKITLLFCGEGQIAMKRFLSDGTCVPFGAGKWFEEPPENIRADSIDDLHHVVSILATCANAFVVRGARNDTPAEIDEEGKPWVQRTLLVRPNQKAYFESVPRTVLFADLDEGGPELRRLADGSVDYSEGSLRDAAERHRAKLPQSVRAAACLFVASSSQHKHPTLRGRLAWILSHAATDAQAKRFFRDCGFDPSLANPVQPIYTAAPIFESGADPIPQRVVRLDGASAATLPIVGHEHLVELAEGQLRAAVRAVREVLTSGGQGRRHDTINKRAYTLGRYCPHLLSEAHVVQELEGALEACTDTARRAQLQWEMRRAIGDGMKEPEHADADLPIVRIGIGVEDRAIEMLSDQGDVYQSGGSLVTLARSAELDLNGETRAIGEPHCVPLERARLQEILLRQATWLIETEKGLKHVRSSRALGEVAENIEARKQWDHIPRLDGIVGSPQVRPDGSILSEPGYDPATYLFSTNEIEISVSERPTREQAAAALATLGDLVNEFPFVGAADRSVWLTALLTLLARPAIDGPTPLFLFTANEAGSGKGLLVRLAGLIASGRPIPTHPKAPQTDEEWIKELGSLVKGKVQAKSFDNLDRMLRSGALDSFLTERWFSARALGVNALIEGTITTVLFATGNNILIGGDTARRVVECRLEAGESPEGRAGFRHHPIEDHVLKERAKYLAAALTIVRWFMVAGMPSVPMKAMGSYEAWSRLVRGALLSLGCEDPIVTQERARSENDVERDELRAVFRAWHAALGDRLISARDLHQAALSGNPELLEALSALNPDPKGGPISLHLLGNWLRRQRDKTRDGLRLVSRLDSHSKILKWSLIRFAGTAGSCGDFLSASSRTIQLPKLITPGERGWP
jgi:putative DNA primase/helicase